MSSINQVAISGNVGRVDLRRTPNGAAVLEIAVAVNSWRKNEEYTSWIICNTFGERAEKLQYTLQKGMPIAVSGELYESRWETQDGQKRSRITVTIRELAFLGQRQEREPVPQAEQVVQQSYPEAQVEEQTAYAQDDIPF